MAFCPRVVVLWTHMSQAPVYTHLVPCALSYYLLLTTYYLLLTTYYLLLITYYLLLTTYCDEVMKWAGVGPWELPACDEMDPLGGNAARVVKVLMSC